MSAETIATALDAESSGAQHEGASETAIVSDEKLGFPLHDDISRTSNRIDFKPDAF